MCLYVLKVTLKVTSVHSDAKGAICIFSGLYRWCFRLQSNFH